MTYDEIFTSYYTQYRAEAQAPISTDDEYTIGVRFANNAIRRWAYYDNTFWRELHTSTMMNGTGGALTTVAGTASYLAPTAMYAPGGYIQLRDGTGKIQKHIPIINAEDRQFRSQDSNGAYFTGNPNAGFTLVFITAPTTSGLTIFYPYYRKPTYVTTGTDKIDVPDLEFVIQQMLAYRFRASRNPYFGTARQEAADLLAQMKMANDSGSWANPWIVNDRSGAIWGADTGSNWSW